MGIYIKLLEDFNPEEDLDPILPVKEEDEPVALELEPITVGEDHYVLDVASGSTVAGPFTEKPDAIREIDLMQGQGKQEEEPQEHKHAHEEAE